MSDVRKERLLEWLRDAHAMEVQARSVFKGQAERIEHYPQLKTRLEQQCAESQAQAERLAACIEQLGSSTSTLKDTGGKLLALGQNLSGVLMEDEVVKSVLSLYSFVHMEIGSYRILIAAAQEAGEPRVHELCAQSLKEQTAFAEWLGEHLAPITQQYLLREVSPGSEAKR